MSIKVKKRNGQLEELNIDKIKKVIAYACKDFEKCSPTELELDSKIQFNNNMTTKEIQKILIQTAIEKIICVKDNVKEVISDWQYVASRLLLYDLYKESGINRKYNKIGYDKFYELIETLTEQNIYGKYILENYTKEDILELEKYIKPERDYLFNYDGLSLLNNRYLAKDLENKTMELPQERFMIIAMHLAIPEKEKKVFYAKKFYDLMSQLKMTVATSTLSNAGRNYFQLSSCFVSVVDDTLNSIYDVNNKFAQVSKSGGALGIYLGKVRAMNSDIKGNKNVSGGVIPWVKLYNDTAIAVDQLGRRKGSCSITLDIWHKDIFDFLDLKTNNGDDRRKAHDIFPSVSIPDIFMERLKERKDWTLFDPYEVKKVMGYYLEDCFDDYNNLEFSKKYEECENNPKLSRINVPCLDIMKKILKSAVETGTPFIFFRDIVNRQNPNKHNGMIYSSNLCHEICQNMSASGDEINVIDFEDNVVYSKKQLGDMVTCNLNSINLGKVSKEEFADCISLQIRMLDNVISLNDFPTPETVITSKKYRAIGLGTSGYHQFLVNNKIKWESEEHLKVADEVYEEIAYNAIKASMELAKEKGIYLAFKGSDWETGKYFEIRNYNSERWLKLKEDVAKYGIRNGYLMAIAPTGSTSNIANTTAGIDPIFKKYFVEEKKGIFIPKTAPDLTDENFWLYKEAHNINQEWSIEACAIRQRHIDQSQSFNLYITPDMNVLEIFNLYMRCWEKGVKTIYYVRNKSLEMNECTSCSS